jgi:hypothetical protein
MREECHVAANLPRQSFEPFRRRPEIPQPVKRQQRCRRIARTTTQPGLCRIAFSSTIRAPRRLPADALKRSAAFTTRLSLPTGNAGSLHRRLISPDGSNVKVKVS